MSGETRHYLISLDADKIQSYVFESARLPEVRGALAPSLTFRPDLPGGKSRAR